MSYTHWTYFVETIFIFTCTSFVFVKWFLPKIIDTIIQEKLATHKYELAKLEYNFQLYTQKQHKIFLKFHQLYGEAKSRVLYLTGLQSWPDFSKYSRQDIIEFMNKQKIKILESTRRKILDYYDKDNKKLAVDELNKLMSIINNNLAENSIYNAHNFALENQLYIPDEIFNLSQDLYEELFKFKILYGEEQKQRDENIKDYLTNFHESKDKIENLYVEITKKLKEHMQKGSLN